MTGAAICPTCKGAGKVPAPAPVRPLAPCGHPMAAIFDADHNPRPCVLCGKEKAGVGP